jgi:hypothetical protein
MGTVMKVILKAPQVVRCKLGTRKMGAEQQKRAWGVPHGGNGEVWGPRLLCLLQGGGAWTEQLTGVLSTPRCLGPKEACMRAGEKIQNGSSRRYGKAVLTP